MSIKRYYGKYRGTVLNCIDPDGRARIQAQVPAVSSLLPTTWCEACLPVASIESGAYFVPIEQSAVWIEFEEGDPNRPIWTGCFWGTPESVPDLALAGVPASPSIVLQTGGQNTVMISDLPGPTGGILLSIGPPPGAASVSVSDSGIILQTGVSKILMTAAGVITITNGAANIVLSASSVAVNGPALVVT